MQITSQTAQAGTPTSASEAQTQLGLDMNNFLKLLTAQITNQDPLKPMDSTTFVSQLAQLSQVEQAVATNDKLGKLGQQLTNSNEFSDLQLIGHQVVLASDNLDLSSGQAQIQYELSKKAQQVSINVIGLNGDVIKTITGLPTAEGVRQTVHWDGLNAAGQQVADGAYKFKIVAVNSESAPVSSQSFAVTHVQELAFRNGQPTLLLRNGQEVPSGVILSVK